MVVSISLNLRLKQGQNDFRSLDVNNSDKLDVLQEEAAKISNISQDEIMLLHCGARLNPTDTVAQAGLAAGDCIHCFRIKAVRVDEATPLTTVEAHEVHAGLTGLMRGKTRHPFCAHLQSPAFSSAAMAAVSGSWRDTDAVAVLQSPVVLYNYAKDNVDNLVQVMEARPVLGRLLQYAVRSYHRHTPPATPLPVPTTAFSLDALYDQDDENDDDDYEYTPRVRQGGGGGGGEASGSSGGGGGSYHSLPVITPAQLAAALANASGGGSGGGGGGGRGPSNLPTLQPPQRGGGGVPSMPATPSNTPASASNTPASASNTPASHTPASMASASHTPASASASTPHQQASGGSLPLISSEMLNTALQSVLGANPASVGTTAPPPPPPRAASTSPAMEESLRLMAEMGIPDEALSRQALNVTNGDVQAAVQLVLAQLNMYD